jgi:hypothetical protein
MRHFIGYHNQKKMGYSCVEITTPRVQTRRFFHEIKDSTVWLIAGEGCRPKSYYLAARFIAAQCEPNPTKDSEFPYLVSGSGMLFHKNIPLDSSILLEKIRVDSANFVRGLYETQNREIISHLTAFI